MPNTTQTQDDPARSAAERICTEEVRRCGHTTHEFIEMCRDIIDEEYKDLYAIRDAAVKTGVFVFANGELIAKVANVNDVKLFTQHYPLSVAWNMDGSSSKNDNEQDAQPQT